MLPRSRLAMTALILVTILVTSMGCSTIAGTRKEEATPTPIPPPPVPEKPTYTVKLGEVVDSLSFTGRISPVVEEELFFKDSGRVKKVYVERDQDVVTGTLLAELENDDLMRQLAQAKLEQQAAELNLKSAQDAQQHEIDRAKLAMDIQNLQLAQAQSADLSADVADAKANLALVRAGATPEELAMAQLRIESAKSSLWGAQSQRDAVCAGSDKAACDGTQASVQQAQNGVQMAELQLQLLKRGPSAQEIAAAQGAYDAALQRQKSAQIGIEILKKQIQAAQLDLDYLNKQLDPQLVNAVDRAKLAVERLQAQSDATRITSPIAGKVTSVSAYEGREVEAYKAVFVVADQSKLEITAEPLSNQLEKLSEGMPAAVILSAYPGKELPAKIKTLPYPYGSGGSAATSTSGSSDSTAVDKATHIEFDMQDIKVQPGDLVKLIVTLQKKSDALWLPPAAIRTFAGRKFVVVDEGGVQKRVDVTIGIESAEKVEIKDGLKENQVVVGQ